MPPRTHALITRSVLRWARERRNISEDTVARRLRTSSEKVRAWETDDSTERPTLRQAQNIAGILNIPLGYLFLSDPPSLTTELPDLRTVSGESIQNPSPELLDQLYDVRRKQAWFQEFQVDQGAAPLPFIGRFGLSDEPDAIARDICEVIGIDDKMRSQASSWEAFLTSFVRKAEAAGILVFRSGVVVGNTHRPLSVDEFRGFALSDGLAPAIFVNTKDYKVAQTFTLAHELAHLWIDKSGISNLDYAVGPERQVNQIDRLCDRVAAQVLVPREDFLGRWARLATTAQNVQTLARHYRVSRFVALRRAYEADVITEAEFFDLYDEYTGDSHPPSGEGGDFYNLFFARNSTAFTSALLTATAEGQVSRLNSARLLNIRVDTIERARRELFGAGNT